MGFLKKMLDFYINSSIHVSLSVCALVLITCLEFNISPNFTLLAFMFLATVSGYNFVKYAAIAGLHHRSLTNSLKSIQIFSFICFAALFFFVSQLSVKMIFTIALFGLLTLFYAVPVFKNKNLRNLSGLKIFIVALVWAGVTVIIPLVYAGAEFEEKFAVTFIQRFLFVVVLILPFEIRDMNFDSTSLGTLPQKIGIFKTKITGAILLLIAILIEIFKAEIEWPYILSFIVIGGISILFLKKSNGLQKRFFTTLWVEALPIFWLGIYLLIRHFFL